MNELKALVFSIKDLAYVDECEAAKNLGNPHDHAVYKATDVDKVIAELKEENKRLKGSCPILPPVQQGPSPQRWMAATNPPHNMREVLVCIPIHGRLAVCLGHYNYSSGQWYLHDRYDPTEVAYWSEKPLPPEK